MPLFSKTTSLTALSFATAMIAALACGRSNETKEEPLSQTTTTSAASVQIASCDMIGATGSCSEYSSLASSNPFGVERALCRGSRGDFITKACPSIGRIGSCDLGHDEVKRYYTGEHGFTAETARLDCEENGQRGKFIASLH